MKRSRNIKLLFAGGISLGALAGCTPSGPGAVPISPDSFYANNHLVPGAGYYHAPFNAFYPQPYNYFDPQRKLYYYGGQWGPAPHRSIVNLSAPTAQAALSAEAVRTDVRRGGFGSTAVFHGISS